MIKVEGVSKSYGAFQVLSECSATFDKGEVTVICGPSGSGKSTLIKCVNGLEPIDSGRIEVFGQAVDRNAGRLTKLRRTVGMVFQSFELYPHLKVMDNLTLAPIKAFGKSREEAEQVGRSLLARVGLSDKAASYPGQLSGGQQQRVAIARALATAPQALLFDEPTSALDPEMIKEVLDVMTDLAADGMTMLVVTHEMGFARRVAKRVLFMDGGRIAEDSSTAAFFDAPSTERAKQFLSRILDH